MSPQPFVVPTPRSDDDEHVARALITSGSLFTAGERAQALLWLRRAAASASEIGRDARAVDLFRAAAELADQVPNAFPEVGVGLPTRERNLVEAVARASMDPVAPTMPPEARQVVREAWAPGKFADDDTLHDTGPLDEATLVPRTHEAAQLSIEDTWRAAPDTMRIAARAGTASGIPAPHDRDEPSASAGELRTMASMSSFRVVVLEGEDGAPRIMSLASEADAPEGAATAVLVTAGADDARRIATLLGRRRR